VVSTAEEQAAEEGRTTTTSRPARRRRPAANDPEQDATRKTLETVLEEFGRLNKKVDDLEKERRADLIQERLTRAEQRAENLQTQLRDVLEKEANLQAQTERVDEQLRPESIERQAAPGLRRLSIMPIKSSGDSARSWTMRRSGNSKAARAAHSPRRARRPRRRLRRHRRHSEGMRDEG